MTGKRKVEGQNSLSVCLAHTHSIPSPHSVLQIIPRSRLMVAFFGNDCQTTAGSRDSPSNPASQVKACTSHHRETQGGKTCSLSCDACCLSCRRLLPFLTLSRFCCESILSADRISCCSLHCCCLKDRQPVFRSLGLHATDTRPIVCTLCLSFE